MKAGTYHGIALVDDVEVPVVVVVDEGGQWNDIGIDSVEPNFDALDPSEHDAAARLTHEQLIEGYELWRGDAL